MSDQMTVTIASVPHREFPVAELWYGDWMWAEVHQDGGALGIDLYPYPTGDPWRLDYREVETVLADAKARLTVPPRQQRPGAGDSVARTWPRGLPGDGASSRCNCSAHNRAIMT
jgi:hypothetical protein